MTLAAVLRHLAFAAGLAMLSAVVVRAMIAVRVMDRPDPRKVHTQDTPKGGGVGVVVAFLVGIAVLYRFAEFARLADPYFVGVIEASLAIAVVAFLDDMYDWKFTVKLAAQIMAAVVAVGSGIYIADYHVPYVGPLFIGWLAPPVTILWLLFATNAMNFIDGLNGLAGGVALIASGFLAAIAATHGGWFAYFAALLLAAGLAGFLPFNFPRARIFMGDVGSQFCGFVLAILAVVAGRFDNVELSFLIVPMLLSGVLFDVAFTLVRRALAGERLTEPHRG
ncbi:MAG TPA: MraY family glycosyltransferase, partial [Acetobacteraceae bacterium]|nr:MraY family glycosyltransferase [Acetobacteraceae bacterium]